MYSSEKKRVEVFCRVLEKKFSSNKFSIPAVASSSAASSSSASSHKVDSLPKLKLIAKLTTLFNPATLRQCNDYAEFIKQIKQGRKILTRLLKSLNGYAGAVAEKRIHRVRGNDVPVHRIFSDLDSLLKRHFPELVYPLLQYQLNVSEHKSLLSALWAVFSKEQAETSFLTTPLASSRAAMWSRNNVLFEIQGFTAELPASACMQDVLDTLRLRPAIALTPQLYAFFSLAARLPIAITVGTLLQRTSCPRWWVVRCECLPELLVIETSQAAAMQAGESAIKQRLQQIYLGTPWLCDESIEEIANYLPSSEAPVLGRSIITVDLEQLLEDAEAQENHRRFEELEPTKFKCTEEISQVLWSQISEKFGLLRAALSMSYFDKGKASENLSDTTETFLDATPPVGLTTSFTKAYDRYVMLWQQWKTITDFVKKVSWREESQVASLKNRVNAFIATLLKPIPEVDSQVVSEYLYRFKFLKRSDLRHYLWKITACLGDVPVSLGKYQEISSYVRIIDSIFAREDRNFVDTNRSVVPTSRAWVRASDRLKEVKLELASLASYFAGTSWQLFDVQGFSKRLSQIFILPKKQKFTEAELSKLAPARKLVDELVGLLQQQLFPIMQLYSIVDELYQTIVEVKDKVSACDNAEAVKSVQADMTVMDEMLKFLQTAPMNEVCQTITEKYTGILERLQYVDFYENLIRKIPIEAITTAAVQAVTVWQATMPARAQAGSSSDVTVGGNSLPLYTPRT